MVANWIPEPENGPVPYDPAMLPGTVDVDGVVVTPTLLLAPTTRLAAKVATPVTASVEENDPVVAVSAAHPSVEENTPVVPETPALAVIRPENPPVVAVSAVQLRVD